MLTILHDQIATGGRRFEVARAAGEEVRCAAGATRQMATRLIALGYDPSLPVKIVREDPVLFGPPYHLAGLTLALAAHIDPFAPASYVPEGDVDGPDVAGARGIVAGSAVGR